MICLLKLPFIVHCNNKKNIKKTFVGDVKVNTLLEGSSFIKCKSLKAKMINGETIKLTTAGSTDVGAIYGQETFISNIKGDVHVGLMQGNIKVSFNIPHCC